jgi:hypothetical protein
MSHTQKPDGLYVECGDGWKKLYQPLLDLCELYGAQVLQVKEKFGGLRFYFTGTADTEKFEALSALVDAAEARSYKTCEDCGVYKVLRHDEDGKPVFLVTTSMTGWRRSLCPDCRAQQEARSAADEAAYQKRLEKKGEK